MQVTTSEPGPGPFDEEGVVVPAGGVDRCQQLIGHQVLSFLSYPKQIGRPIEFFFRNAIVASLLVGPLAAARPSSCPAL